MSYGVEYDVIALVASGMNFRKALYLSAFADFGNSRVNVGAVKSAYSQFERETIVSTNGYLGLSFYAQLNRSVVDWMQLANIATSPLGLRYDGSFGNVDVSASFVRVGGGNLFAVAGEYDTGSVQVSSGVEMLTSNPAQHALYLQAAAELGSGDILARFTNSTFSGPANSLELDYMHHFSDKFSAGANLYAMNAGGGSVLVSAQAKYDFGPGYVRGTASYVSSGSTYVGVALGAEF